MALGSIGVPSVWKVFPVHDVTSEAKGGTSMRPPWRYFLVDVGICWRHRRFWRYACRACQKIRYQ
jgi:hypothetical protein